MHHKFCVFGPTKLVWMDLMNWTDDSWTRQENVIAVLRSPEIAYAYTLARKLWDSGKVEGSGDVDPRPESLDGARVRAWFCPEHGGAPAPDREAHREGDGARADRVAGAHVC